MYMRRLKEFAFLLAIMLGSAILTAHAEVMIEGDANALHLQVRQSRISDVFTALGRIARLSYSTVTRSDQIVDGTYSGSLEQVVRRLLDGHNYWIKKQDDTFDIVVVGRRGSQVVLPQAVEPPKTGSVAARWRTP